MVVVAAIFGLQLAASISFYAWIDREALREDHARRVAELLVVSRRVDALTRSGEQNAGEVMTTRYLEASVTEAPLKPGAPPDAAAAAIRRAILGWEPELAGAELSLWTRRDVAGGHDLVGAMRLDDGRWLNFRSRDFARVWPMALRVSLMTVLFAALGLAFAVFVLGQLGRPLRNLAQAARAFGGGRRTPVRVEGSADLSDLGRAFNEMQDRIAGLIEDQARSMEAISHDLRTPLARIQLAAQFAEPDDVRELIAGNVEELDQMLSSLSAFLRAQHQVSAAEPVDIAALTRGVAADFGDRASYRGPEALIVATHRGPLEEALRRLVDNAVRHGGGAELNVQAVGLTGRILIRDHGAGMAAEDLGHIYEPFFRGDRARSRDTTGFGLGVPTAARLLTRFGGELGIANAEDGGLLVTVTPPRAA
jgi:signal transduction histidine kinase